MEAERRGRSGKPKAPTLPPEDSQNTQNQLISELAQLERWGGSCDLGATGASAQKPAFERGGAEGRGRICGQAGRAWPSFTDAEEEATRRIAMRATVMAWQTAAADVVSISKPVRERDRDHLRFVASQPCLVCGRTPSDAHHLKFAEQRAMGRKVSDKFTVPICRLHHRELHRRGNERAWWDKQGIDPLPVAANLWAQTHAVASVAGDEADVDEAHHV